MHRLRIVFTSVLIAFTAMVATLAQEPEPKFYRAINLNGPATTIDGHAWDAGDAHELKIEGMAFESQNIALKPATDPERAKMIRSSRWGNPLNIVLFNVPPGTYQTFAYVWEDNDPEQYEIRVNGRTVIAKFNSGTGGQWKRLGPWKTRVTDGSISISAIGGAANFSGIEVWSGEGHVPDPAVAQFVSTPSEEQLNFFESRIRPLLIDNCYDCHSKDSDELGGGLLLDSRAGIIKGGETERLMVPGDPENSLLMKAVSHKDAELKMPPDSRLGDDQIADLAEWIRMKAPDPRAEDTVGEVKAKQEIQWNEARDFWSLRPIAKVEIPKVASAAWPTNAIDNFIAAKLDAAKLAPAQDADKRTLIRRASYDLIGLPPSPQEIDAFLADESPNAFASVIDRLLSSPQYGERWGRHWLDVVRYSDTAGDNSDFPIPQSYLYRNWVINAFNRDLPYDEFVREQLAGDLIGGDDPETKRQRVIATGYIANARRFGSRVDDYPQHLTIEDTIDNLGRTFLATTINCARCHDHKFDPITAEDYYALYGIFHSTRYPWPGIELEQRQRDFVTLDNSEETSRIQKEREKRRQELESVVNELKKQLEAAQGEARKPIEEKLKEAERIQGEHADKPLPFETLYAIADAKVIEDVAVQLKGDPAKNGPVVERRFLKVLNGAPLVDGDQTSGRSQLANWIVDRNNPLTARVMVNRIWMHHFGQAIVPTANDFGRHGQSPTHPELLDWLAQRFMDSGWSVKSMHRLIMLSHSYRMGSARSAASLETDPANQLISAYPCHRLDAEVIRDTLLLLGGNLDPTPGEAHPFPPQSEWKFTQHNPFKAIYETNRRSVYLMTQRIQRHPYLSIFDGADPSASTPYRFTSTTPLQALYLLNDKFVHTQATGLAKRLISEQAEDTARIERAWVLMFSRPPEAHEAELATNFLKQARAEYTTEGIKDDAQELESWTSLLRSLIRTNQFVYPD